MEYYTSEEINRKAQDFEKQNRVDQIYRHHKKGDDLYTFYQSYEKKKNTIIDIDQIMLDNNLEPKYEIINRSQSSYYKIDIIYRTLFRIEIVNLRAKIKKGLVDDWVEENCKTHFFESNLKLIKLDTITTKWLTNSNDLAKKTLVQLQSFLFDAEYRKKFKKYILNPNLEFLAFNTKKKQFTLYTGITMTLLAEDKVLISFKNGYDFIANKTTEQIIEFELIKKPFEINNINTIF